MTEKELLDLCVKHGADRAFILDVDRIPFDENLRTYCEMNSCGTFGINYACPPAVGDAQAVISEAKSYSKALIFQTIGNLEDSFDFEGMLRAERDHEEVCDRILEEVSSRYPNYLELRVGGCKVCPDCAILEDAPCRFPEKKRASLEAYCMNVADLAEKCGMQYINGANTVTYFGAYLIK